MGETSETPEVTSDESPARTNPKPPEEAGGDAREKNMPDSDKTNVRAIVLAGMLALLGTVAGGVIKGYMDVNLEGQKFQTDLVKKALEPKDVSDRVRSLRFMLEANLITDPELRKSLEPFVTKPDKRDELPRLAPTFSGTTIVPRSEENEGYTDLDLFVCGEATNRPSARNAVAALGKLFASLQRVGEVKEKVWEGPLYKELPIDALKGRLTVIVDQGHSERFEEERLRDRVKAAVPDLEYRVVPNTGSATPWRLSYVVCPTR